MKTRAISRRMLTLLLIIALALAFSNWMEQTHGLSTNGVINVSFSTNAPNINGAWDTPAEWADASEVIISNQYGWTTYVRVKHNFDLFFILLDFVTDQSRGFANLPDKAQVAFDTMDDGADVPWTDDYLFYVDGVWGATATFQGTGKGGGFLNAWTGIGNPAGFAASAGFTYSPYEENRQHQIYEFRVPTRFLGEKSTYGFYVTVVDVGSNTFLEWPLNSGGTPEYYEGRIYRLNPPPPKKWGDIFLPYRKFSVSWNGDTYPVFILSNSSIENFDFDQVNKMISFNVTGGSDTTGYCNVTTPNALLGGPYTVLINDSRPTILNEVSNDTYTFLYFTYSHSTQKVKIIGTTVVQELSSNIILPLFAALSTLAVVFVKRRIRRSKT